MERGLLSIFKVIYILCSILCNIRLTLCGCPEKDGWTGIGDNCVKVYEDKLGWMTASKTCKEKSGNLVSILSESEQESLRVLAAEETYWIGGHIPALVFKSYFNRCVDGFKFRNASCFQINSEYLKWTEAKEMCDNFGGKLALVQDEKTNTFVGNAMQEMAITRNLTSMEDQSPLSFWIDGYSRAGSTDFVDSEGNIVKYTNLESPAKQNGENCLEVFLEKEEEIEQTDLDKLAQGIADDAALEEARKTLPTGLPPGIIPDEGDNQPTDDDDNRIKPDIQPPRYKASGCNERRLSVCEFSLRTVESPNKGSPTEDSDEPKILPSRLSSCENLAILARYVDISCDITGQGSNDNDQSTMSAYVNLKNGYYIFPKREAPKSSKRKNENSSTTEKLYELEFCEVDEIKRTLPDDQDYIKEQFKWIQTVDNQNQAIANLGFLGDNDIYNGPCMQISADGSWNTSRCSENYKFVCEFSTDVIREQFCEKDSTESWCTDSSDNLNRLNKESIELLAGLRRGSAEYILDGSDGADRLQNLTDRAKMLSKTKYSTSSETKRAIENFTSNILTSASILLDPNLCYFDNSQLRVRAIVSSLNTIAEYSADMLQLILLNSSDEDGDGVTALSLNVSGLHLQVIAVGGNQSNMTLRNSSSYFSPNGDTMTMIFTQEQEELIESQGAALINLHYRVMGSEKHTARSLSAVAGEDDHDPFVYPSKKKFYVFASDLQTATLRINGSNIPTNVEFAMTKEAPATDLRIMEGSEMCSFLQDSDESTESAFEWSTDGCVMRLDVESDKYHCQCNHTTDFAVLLVVYESIDDLLEGHRFALCIITIVGHILSLVCLLISIILFSALKREIKSDRRMIHVNLFVALFFANAVLLTSQVTSRAGMLIGIDDAEGDKTYPACIVLTFFNHFLLLTAMFWMLIEGIVIYRKIVVVLSSQRKTFNNAYHLFGWGIPLIISMTSALTGALSDIDYHSAGCWLSVSSGMIWAFAGPAILVILVNSVILVMVLRVAMRTQKRKVARRADATDSDKSKLTRLAYLQTAVRGIVVLTPLLGLTWMIGLLMFHVSVAYIFVVLNAFQGVAIFICYCVCNPEIRAALDMKWKHYKARHFTSMHEERPLATSYRMDRSGWMKTKLLMRLSFSTSNSRPNDRFNSMQKNSETIEEKDESENSIEKDRYVHYNGNKVNSSAESNASSSSMEFSRTDSPASLSRKLNRKKLTAKVNPESSMQRTSTTAERKPERKHHRKRTQSENNPDSDIPVDDHGALRHTADDINSAHQRYNCEVTGRDDSDIRAEIPKPDIRDITRKPNNAQCELCSRDYYNPLENDIPVRLYSNTYIRKNKPKKDVDESDEVINPNRDTCIPRCCPECQPPDINRAPRTITIYGTHKTNYRHKAKLDTVDFNSSGRYHEDRHRPCSRISRDSGILPDDIGDFDATDPL